MARRTWYLAIYRLAEMGNLLDTLHKYPSVHPRTQADAQSNKEYAMRILVW